MIRTMIVEDEPPILRSIKKSIECTDNRFKVVACAYDGSEAVPLLGTVRPDVIFTDIRMPVMDGIAFLIHARKVLPDVKVVIISGYQDFEYARKAMQHGAIEYILKPVSIDSLKNLLEAIAEDLGNKTNDENRRLVHEILEGNTHISEKSIIDLIYPDYLVMLICAGPLMAFTADYSCPARDYLGQFDLEGIARRHLDTNENLWSFTVKSGAEKVLVAGMNGFDPTKVDILSKGVFSSISSPRFFITMIVGMPVKRPEDIARSAQDLRKLLSKNVTIGMSQIIKAYARDNNKNDSIINQKSVIDSYVENRIAMSARQGNIKILKSEMQRLFDQWENCKYPQIIIEKSLRYVMNIIQRINISGSYESTLDNELSINEVLVNSYNYEELFENTWFLVERIISAGRVIPARNDKTILMQNIEAFIRVNMTEPVSNQLLSEKFGLVPSYLSRLFKEYKGMTPSEYITSLRIEKAQELIKTRPDMFIKDIASMVGFSNQFYFSESFKKKTGLWPSQYKNDANERLT